MPLKAPSDRAESFTLLSIKIAMEKKFCEHLTAYGRGKCKHDPLQTKWCAHSRNKGKLLCCPINKTITKKEWKLQWHWEFREHERNSLIGREKLRKYSRTYHSRHREEVNEWHNIWLRKRLKDPVFKEKYLEYQRNYRKTDKFKANQKKYRESEGYKKLRREIEIPTHADFERNKELARMTVTSDGMAYSTGFVVHKVKIGDLYFCVYKKKGIFNKDGTISGYRIQEIRYGKYEKWYDCEDYIEFFKSIGIQTKKEEGAKGQEKEMPNLQGEGSKDKKNKLAERQSILPI